MPWFLAIIPYPVSVHLGALGVFTDVPVSAAPAALSITEIEISTGRDMLMMATCVQGSHQECPCHCQPLSGG